MPFYAPLWALVLMAEAAAGVSLTTDARVGTLRDPVGGVVIRQAGEARGVPVGEETALVPGDRVDVDLHVAGAVTLDLGDSGRLILGPGAQIAVSTEKVITWLAGPVHAIPAAGKALTLTGPDSALVSFDKEQSGEARAMKVVMLEAAPAWVGEYRKGTSLRSLGTLTASVEGKEVALGLVRHAVTVEIRDGLALTTVENVFRNSTDVELEGVFEFPLPQDASVAEFGVWFGDRLVLADVAEKMRARQVYQTLMMERKAPGLLEVAEGNRFRTRIYPIPANGEKRIRISYTQVLGWNGHGWNYAYPLVSEMTRTAGLEELRIHVVVWSQRAIQSVKSLYHPAAVESGPNSARVEYTVQGARPDHDFNLDISVSNEPGQLVWMSHVQGKDGYFLASLVLPQVQAVDQARTKPVELIFWVDSSGSMGADERKKQREIVLGVLQALGPDDRFRLVACDGQCVWMDTEAKAANGETILRAAQFMEQRISLGWTDLKHSLASVLKVAGPETQILYLGDGLESKAGADSVRSAEALEKVLSGFQGRLSAVAMGRASDRIVLTRMTKAGRGTLVDGTGDAPSGRLVAAVLGGLTSVPEVELTLEATGVKLGAVVPSVGTADGQRVWVGRFDPAGLEADAQVVVRPVSGEGSAKAEPVGTVVPSLPEEGRDNSLVVRFWARRYIDQLLESGDAAKAKEEVIGLSEEYGVLSPYTSFIVIDSDAERARFGVKRLVRMGNGERFFGEARAKAETELAQKAMMAGQRWRRSLRTRLAQRLSRPDLANEPWPHSYGPYSGDFGVATGSTPDSTLTLGWGEIGGSGGLLQTATRSVTTWEFEGGDIDGKIDLNLKRSEEADKEDKPTDGRFDLSEQAIELPPAEPAAAMPAPDAPLEGLLGDSMGAVGRDMFEPSDREYEGEGYGGDGDFSGMDEVSAGETAKNVGYRKSSGKQGPAKREAASGRNSLQGVVPGTIPLGPQEEPWWMADLVPRPVPVPAEPAAPKASKWPAEAVELSKTLARNEWLASQKGLRVVRRSEAFLSGAPRPYSISDTVLYQEPGRWVMTDSHTGMIPFTFWSEAGVRGDLNQMTWMARVREAVAGDTPEARMYYSMFLTTAPHLVYPDSNLVVKRAAKEVVFEISYPGRPDSLERFTIDESKRLVVKTEVLDAGEVLATSEVESFAEVGGVWMPAAIVSKDGAGKVTNREHLEWTLVSQSDLDGAFESLHDQLKKSIQFHTPVPTLAEAKERLAENKGTDADLLVLIAREASLSRFDRATEAVGRLAKRHADKAGHLWLRLVLQAQARKQDDAEGLLNGIASKWIGSNLPGSYFAATYLYRQATQVLIGDHLTQFVERLKPLYETAQFPERGLAEWGEIRAQAFDSAGRTDEARQLRLELARKYPGDLPILNSLVWMLMSDGETSLALELIEAGMVANKGVPGTLESLIALKLDVYSNQYDGEALLAEAKAWAEQATDPWSQAYQRYIAALESVGEGEAADKLAQQWMEQALKAGKTLTRPQQGRLNAAVNHAVGWGYSSYTGRVKPGLADLVAEVMYVGLEDTTFSQVLYAVYSHEQFKQMPAGARLRERLRAEFLKRDKPLSVKRANALWTAYQSLGIVDPKDALAVLEVLNAQARQPGALDDPTQRQLYATTINMVAVSAALREEQLSFQRVLLAKADAEQAPAFALELFSTLTGGVATQAQLDEAAGLILRLGMPKDLGEQALLRLAALDRLAHAWSIFERRERVTTLRGGENRFLRANELAALDKAVREAVAVKVAAIGTTYPELAVMARLKELALWVSLEKRVPETLDQSLTLMEEQSGPSGLRVRGRAPLLERASQLASSAALLMRDTRSIERVIALHEKLAKAASSADERIAWQLEAVALLTATDQPDELEKMLHTKLEAGVSSVSWDVMLAAILAERGQIKKAADLLEKAGKREPLDGLGLSLLRDLRTALPGQEGDEKAKLKEYLDTAQEWEIHNLVQTALNKQRVEGAEPRASDDLLLKLRALFAKATYPQNYVYIANQAFTLTQDGRVLVAILESLAGMSDEQVGALLLNMVWAIQGIQNEAALDAVAKELEKMLAGAENPRLKRQIAMVQLMVERAGTTIAGSGKGHAQKAMAAMNQATDGVSEAGESANVLAIFNAMGTFDDEELSKLRSRISLLLLVKLPEASARRLAAAAQVANILGYAGDYGAGYDLLMHELDARLKVTDGLLDREEYAAVDSLVALSLPAASLLKTEEYLNRLSKEAPQRQKAGLLSRKVRLYATAVTAHATMAEGKGLDLVKASLKAVDAMVADSAPNQVSELMYALSDLFRNAKYSDLNVQGLMPEFQKAVLTRYSVYAGAQWSNVIQIGSGVVKDVLSARDSLVFLLGAMGQGPKFNPYYGYSVFGQLGYQIGYLMDEIGNLGDLEKQILDLVLQELRADLLSGRANNRQLYTLGGGQKFQTKNAGLFLKEALKVGEGQLECPPCAAYTAQYIAGDLDKAAEAAALLEKANKKFPLQDSWMQWVAQLWVKAGKYDRAFSIASVLSAKWPDNLQLRLLWLESAGKSKKFKDAEKVLADSVAHWKKLGQWTAYVAGSLGLVASDSGLTRSSIPLLGEAISERQVKGGLVRQDLQLSGYLLARSKAELVLGQHRPALEDALAGMLAGGTVGTAFEAAKGAAMATLQAVQPLDKFMAVYEKEEEAAGQVHPLLHAMAAKVYVEAKRPSEAVRHYRISLEARPDADVLLKLMNLLKEQGKTEELVAEGLSAARKGLLTTKAAELLSAALFDLGRPEDALRALTSAVESSSDEPQPRSALAAQLVLRKLGSEAVSQWQIASELAPKDGNLLLSYASALIAENRFAEARTVLETALKANWLTSSHKTRAKLLLKSVEGRP